ncbi:hypothetical protein JNK13_03095 [bacterium]|nr:hypothetical protein [bacterium]
MPKLKSSSIAEETQSYINQHPGIKECLRSGLINHTALAREICKARRISSIDAVVMASTRYAKRIEKQRRHENTLRQMLAEAKILVRSKVMLAAWEHKNNLSKLLPLYNRIYNRGGEITIVEGHKLATIFTENEFADEIKKVFGSEIKLLVQDLVKITLLLPEKVTFTHGYAAYMFHLIAERGINMLGDVTSTAEHIFIIEEKDLPQALDALKVRQSG